MAVKGVFASDMGVQGGRNGGFEDGLLTVNPTGTASLLALSSGMESMDWNDTIVTWFEEVHMTGRVQITNAPGVAGVSFVLDDASQITPTSILNIEAFGEYVFVESVVGNTLTVQRGLGGTVPGNIVALSYAQRIGNAQEEGSGKPVSVANVSSPRFNYMQTFRNSWDVTGTAQAVNYRTGNLKAKNRADAGILHAEDRERSMLWGIRTIGVRNNKPYHTMAGVTNQLTSNITAAAGTTTWRDIDQFLQDIFSRNIKGKPNERIAFCGNTVIQVLNEIALLNSSYLTLAVGQTDFGMEITKWRTPYGTISLMTHPLFNESPFYTKNLLVLHPGAVRTRYLRRTFEDSNDVNGSRNGVDADFGILTTEMTCEYRAEQTGGYFTNITTAAAN